MRLLLNVLDLYLGATISLTARGGFIKLIIRGLHMQLVLVRYAEIGTKGKNRPFFERVLIQNISKVLADKPMMERRFGRILISTDQMPDLSKVYGISSYSTAVIAGNTIEELTAKVKPLLSFDSSKSFRVTCSRLDKTFTLTSQEVAAKVGAFVQEQTGAKVKLKNFDKEIVIEIINGKFYVITETFEGPGGLPQGTEGTVLALINSDASKRAANLVARRGCFVIPIESEKEIDSAAKEHKAKAVVVGDTLQDLRDYKTEVTVLRPLVGGVA